MEIRFPESLAKSPVLKSPGGTVRSQPGTKCLEQCQPKRTVPSGTVSRYLAGTVHGDEKYSGISCLIIPYPTGRLFRGGLYQALRARLRSACPLRDSRVVRLT